MENIEEVNISAKQNIAFVFVVRTLKRVCHKREHIWQTRNSLTPIMRLRHRNRIVYFVRILTYMLQFTALWMPHPSLVFGLVATHVNLLVSLSFSAVWSLLS